MKNFIVVVLQIIVLVSTIKCDEDESTNSSPTASTLPVQSDCETFLANKTAIQKCCAIPESSDVPTQTNCYSSCSTAPRDKFDKCLMECYLSVTRILDIDHRILNKEVVKKIYNANAHNINWLKIIDEGVERCNFVSAEDIDQSLLKFYNCVNDYLTENCASFFENPFCTDVEEQFENCKPKTYDCTKWPCGMASPEICCDTPQILTDEIRQKCDIACQRKEFLLIRRIDCNFNCTFIETGVVVGEKINFENVKKMLVEHSNKPEWEKLIESATSKCEGRYRGKILLNSLALKIHSNFLETVKTKNTFFF